MAEKHIARYGKVWKNRKTGAILGAELELKKDESVKGYTQINAPTEAEKSLPVKSAKSTSIFESEANN